MADDRSHLSGAERIAEERHRQIALGWSRAHDAEHDDGSLLASANAYLMYVADKRDDGALPIQWPWEPESWHPSVDPIRNLEKAGALIAAEIDRLTLVEPPKGLAYFKGGPWDGQSYAAERIVGPVFAAGHEIGNHYWLDSKSAPPTYHWDGSGVGAASGEQTP